MMLNASAGSWLSFRDYEGKVLLYFTHLMSYRPLIKEVRYSLNSDCARQDIQVQAERQDVRSGRRALPHRAERYAEFATVQVTFKDGTVSPPQKVVRGEIAWRCNCLSRSVMRDKRVPYRKQRESCRDRAGA